MHKGTHPKMESKEMKTVVGHSPNHEPWSPADMSIKPKPKLKNIGRTNTDLPRSQAECSSPRKPSGRVPVHPTSTLV